MDKIEWRCFHCNEIFIEYENALLHFGGSILSDTACQVDIRSVREMEKLLARYRSEDSDTDRAMYQLQAEHAVALRREEEKGYRRGLIDQVFTNG